MKNEEKENPKKPELWWKPAVLFYAKTTGWIVAPAFLALFLDEYLGGGKFLVLVLLGFLVTCYGIYREVKVYKKDLDKAEKNGNK